MVTTPNTTPRKPTIDQSTLIKQLRDMRARRGKLSARYVRNVARTLGCHERTVWRLANRDPAACSAPRGYQPPERALELYFECTGNVSAVHRAMTKEGLRPPSLATLDRALKRELPERDRKFAVSGAEGRRNSTVHLRRAPMSRNVLWEADHVELPVLVLAEKGSELQKVWMTSFIDVGTRAIMGFAIDRQPHAGTVCAALRRAVDHDPGYGPFCGIPEEIHWDNGLEFLADSVTEVAVFLGIDAEPVRAYAPHLKGVIERFQRTIQQELISTLPLYTDGPRNADDSLADHTPGAYALTLEELYELVAAWVDEYNHKRPHGGLDKKTPLEVWNADNTPLNVPSAESVRWLTTPQAERKVGKSGIRWNRLDYIAPELVGIFGERVQIAFQPHDERQIEVYRDGDFLCVAKPQGTLSDAEVETFGRMRRDSGRRADGFARKRKRRAAIRTAPMTHPGSAARITEVTDEDALAAGFDLYTHRAKARTGSTSILDAVAGLNEPLPQPKASGTTKNGKAGSDA